MASIHSSSKRLQKILLSWDYWDLNTRTQDGEGAMPDLKAVPSTFSSIQVTCGQHNVTLLHQNALSHVSASVQDYISVFEPLVLEECGALILRGNEEALAASPHQAVVAVTQMVSSLYHSFLNSLRATLLQNLQPLTLLSTQVVS